MKQGKFDPRPSWNMKHLPCIRNYLMKDGNRLIEVDPDYESRYRAHLLSTAVQPDWRTDPTYNLNRKAKT